MSEMYRRIMIFIFMNIIIITTINTHMSSILLTSYFFVCCLLYSHVTLLALLTTSWCGTILWQGSSVANFIDSILERVLSKLRLGRNGVLFFLTNENTLSSSALGCGIIKTTFAIFERRENIGRPSVLLSIDRWCHSISLRW